MRSLIWLGLFSTLMAGSAIAAQAEPQAYCVNDKGELYPYDGKTCNGHGQLASGNCRLTDGRLIAVVKNDCLAQGGSIELPTPATIGPPPLQPKPVLPDAGHP